MTGYDDYVEYSRGEDDWEYNTEMSKLFADRLVRGTLANRPAAADCPDNAIYYATDEGIIYENDPNDGWVVIGGTGDYQPQIDSLDTDLSNHTGSSSAHGSNGDIAGMNDLFSGSHNDLTDVASDDHHAKPGGGTGLGFDSTNNVYNALLGNALATDANGNIAVQESNIALSNLSGYPIDTGDMTNMNYVDFSNNERGDFDTDGRLYWDLSAGLYIKSSNAPNPETGGRLLWSGANVSAGDGISISYGSEDKPTISSEAGGISYVQTSEPAYDEGKTWLNPDTGVYYAAYDAGNGGDWHPIPPVYVTEETITFDESGISLSLSGAAQLNNGSIEIGGTQSTFYSYYDYDSSFDMSDAWLGLGFTPKEEITGLRVDTWQLERSYGDWRVQNLETGTTIAQQGGSGLSNGDELTWSEPLDIGVDHAIQVNSGDGNDDFWTDFTGFPVEETEFTIFDNMGHDRWYWFQDISVIQPRYSGSATVSWDNHPDQIEAWDMATYQRTLDNETVTVDILDQNDNVLFSNITPNYDISTADTADNVKFQVELSRDTSTNNPTFDYAARRYTR